MTTCPLALTWIPAAAANGGGAKPLVQMQAFNPSSPPLSSTACSAAAPTFTRLASCESICSRSKVWRQVFHRSGRKHPRYGFRTQRLPGQ